MLLTLPYSFSQLGMLSGVLLQLFYGFMGSWTAYLISVLYVEYRSRKEKEGVSFKNHVIQVPAPPCHAMAVLALSLLRILLLISNGLLQLLIPVFMWHNRKHIFLEHAFFSPSVWSFSILTGLKNASFSFVKMAGGIGSPASHGSLLVACRNESRA